MCLRCPEWRVVLALALAAAAGAGCRWSGSDGAAATVAPGASAEAERGSGPERPARVLRIAADPNNLPFTDERLAGFENRIAGIIAADLGARVEYVWHAQRRGFFRETLKEGRADVVMGVPTGSERALTTRPYYRSTYVFVSRKERGLGIESFDDPRLRELRIGVQLIGDDGNSTPASLLLAKRGIIGNLVGFSVYGDYRETSPPARIVDAVARGDVDVAVVWGPMAAYFAGRQPVALDLMPVRPAVEPPGIPMVFDISVGVAKGNTALRDELDGALDRHRAEIGAVLDEYRVPRGDPAAVLPAMGDGG